MRINDVPHRTTTLLMIAVAASLLSVLAWGAPPDDVTRPEAARPTAKEARGQARLLHETVHATLQIVHHEYYRDDEGLTIPAATLKRVFQELASRQKVELSWLAVNAQAMNTDHQPRTDFENKAVEALASGQADYEQVADGVYRRASTITLTSDCLKCHAPSRMSNKDRLAGLVIAIPVSE